MHRITQDRIKQAIRKVLIEGMDDFGTGANTRPPGDMTQPISNGYLNNPNRSYYNGAPPVPTDDFGNPIGPRRPQFNPRAPIGNGNPNGVPNPPGYGQYGGRIIVRQDGTIVWMGPNGYPYGYWDPSTGRWQLYGNNSINQ